MKAPEAIIKGLTSHLKLVAPSLQAVYDEWPNASQKLLFPSITLLIGEPKFIQVHNYVVGKNTTPEIDGKYKYQKVNGSFDFTLKAHLWADSKPKRHELFDLFMNVMNPSLNVSGLRLKLTNYFDEWATFDVSNVVWLDNEESVQRSERRVIVDILVNVRSVIETSDYLIETIENNLETPASIPNVADGGDTTII